MSDSNKEKYKELLTEDAIKAYSMRNGLSRDEAIKKLIENFEKEENTIDSKAIVLQAMKGIRILSPKVQGLEFRERDMLLQLNQIQKSVNNLENQIKDSVQRLQLQIHKLRDNSAPKGFLARIKWLLMG